MIILKKKKVLYIIMCLILSITVYGFKTKKGYETLEVVSTPVTAKVIVLDAGHGRRRWWSGKYKWNK